MKKLVKLTAVLVALMCVFAASAVAEGTLLGGTVYEGTQTNVDSGEYHAALTADELAAQALYEQIMASSDLAEIVNMILNDANNNGAYALMNMKAEHLNGIKGHADALFAVVEDPEQKADAIWTYQEAYDEIIATLEVLAEGLGIELYAADENKTFSTNTTLTGDYTLTGVSTWKIENDAVITVNGRIIVSNSSSLTITGNGTIIRGTGEKEVINVYGSGSLNVTGTSDSKRIVIDGANKATAGSLIRVDGNVTLTNVTLQNNQTSIVRNYSQTGTDDTSDNFAGGAITICDTDNKTTTLDNCIIRNTSAASGGGIYVTRTAKGNLNIIDTQFINCKATEDKFEQTIEGASNTSWGYGGGGAIFMDGRASYGETIPSGGFLSGMTVNITRGKIDNCTSVGCGSAVYMNETGHATVNMTGVTVQNCVSNGSSCGTIRCDGNGSYKLTVDNCTIQNNTSKGNGGGIYWNGLGEGASLKVTRSQILNNTASSQGGGLFVEGSQMNVTNTIIKGNSANYGGGIGIKTFADGAFKDNPSVTGTSFNLTLGENVIVEENTAALKGGGVAYYIEDGVPASGFVFNYTNDGAIIRNNSVTAADGVGGGIAIIDAIQPDDTNFPNRVYDANVFMKSGEIHGNNATDGGGVYMNMGNFEMSGGKINTHDISGNGGAVYIEDGDFSISDGEIYNNKANLGAGAYVVGGDFLMSGGMMKNNNSSTYGGAAYVDGGNFTMESGTMDSNTATNDGGGVYVTGGDVVIGVQDCADDHLHPVLKNNVAVNGGAIAVAGSTPIMYCGEMAENTASTNGGAVYVTGGSFTMNGGVITENHAVDGAGAYVTGDGISFTMSNDAALIDNVASGDGGAAYINGGNFIMNNGTLDGNDASGDGGAAYVNNGSFTMHHGLMDGNTATNGGAVYVNGSFTMESGTMTNNQAIERTAGQAEAGKEGYGGAVFAQNGNLTIGISGCTQSNPVESHKTGKTTHHPIVTENTAEFGGGLAIRNGTIYIHCCKILENESDNEGTGMNVFMDGANGVIDHYYDGGVIGENTNHGMVTIGGKLNVIQNNGDVVEIEIIYHSNYSVDLTWEGVAPKDYYLNLPYCPTEWQKTQAQSQLSFVGWTESQIDTDLAESVRTKDDYEAIGSPVEIYQQELVNNKGRINFWAVWAPTYNNIAYAYSIDGENVKTWNTSDDFVKGENAPDQYMFQRTSYTLPVSNPTKAGYAFVKWMMYADTSKIANWNADPTSIPVDLVGQLKDPTPWKNGLIEQNFGDIVLVAIFEPEYADMKIIKNGWNSADENQSYIFHVVGTPTNGKAEDYVDLYVAINKNGEATIKHIPVGKYTVTELEDWSWRYNGSLSVKTDDDVEVTKNADDTYSISDPAKVTKFMFSNSREETKWLDGDCYTENTFNAVSTN